MSPTTASGGGPRLYSDLASWFHLVTTPASYAEETDYICRVLIEYAVETPKTILELGSGGGNNASHLKRRFDLTLVDSSEPMLDLSRELNPECEHVVGDMRDLRLERSFDVVLIHDAIMHITEAADLVRTMETAYRHLEAGGVAFFMPDCIRETFRPKTRHGGHDSASRALRFVEWTYDPDEDDTTFIVDFAFLLRQKTGETTVEYDRHVNGLFSRDEWQAAIAQVGFSPRIDRDDPYGRECYVGLRGD